MKKRTARMILQKSAEFQLDGVSKPICPFGSRLFARAKRRLRNRFPVLQKTPRQLLKQVRAWLDELAQTQAFEAEVNNEDR